MVDIKVAIHAKDRKIGAMVKALAFEVGGPRAVEGASKEHLETNGYLVFHFHSIERAKEFSGALDLYLPGFFARIMSAE